MPSMPTLHIAEYQRFTQSDIETCLKQFYKKQDSKNAESNGDRESSQAESQAQDSKAQDKAKKIFDDLQDFAKQKGNGKFLHFDGRNALKAKNYVGLIQTKSGFCVEILPKTFKDKGFDAESHQDNLCDYHKDDTHKAPKFDKQTFANNEVKPFINHITQSHSEGCKPEESNPTESKKDSSLTTQVQNDKNNANPSNPESHSTDLKHNAQAPSHENSQCPICQIHHAKQILLNCLATLKDSPFRQTHIASLQSNLPLIEAFVLMFCAQLEQLIHRGLKSDYVQIAQNRAFLKGKLLFNENLKHNLTHKERFFTQSDEYTIDSPPNRLIKRTLEFLRTFSLSPKTRTKLDSVYFVFEEIASSNHIESDFAKCQNMRRAKEYELVLLWCAIFLRQRSFSPYSGSERVFAMLFPMEQLFESFVAHWIKRNVREVGEYEVKCQESSKYLMTESEAIDKSGGLFALNPDMIMRGKGEKKSEILILDTKWKIPDSKGDEKKHGIAQADLYQMWAYASKYALESKSSKSKKADSQNAAGAESSGGDSKEVDSKNLDSQKAPEVAGVESSEDSSDLKSSKRESKVSVWLIYPLCERTEALREKWQGGQTKEIGTPQAKQQESKKAQSPKQWYFKASILHNENHKTNQENQENGAISLSLAFFPLLSP